MVTSLALLCSLFLFWLARGFGKDYESYVDYFNCIVNNSCDLNWEVEPLTLFLAKTVGSTIGIEFLIFLYIFTAIITKILAVKRMEFIFLPFFIYFISFSPLLEVNQIRGAVGIGFSVLAVQLYLEKKLKYASIFFILAISFHYSMAICALILLKRRYLIIICLAIPLVVSMLTVEALIGFSEIYPTFSSKIRLISFASYLDAQPESTIINSKSILSLLISIPVLLKWAPVHVRGILINNLLLLFMSLISLETIPNLFSRISDIFLVIAIFFTLGYCRLRSWYKIVLIIFSIFQFIVSIKFILS